ncbi:hypothetical protein BLNAU_3355 [Blattamonas nauphoetae]|uniref:Uncharacterized protein n=1 Tax=Blattamonas nauphoetae TaxID=2049346 RepID=A0ABQ9YCR8_9EUKA|nr:hypothetical protein BLNAU_3355 [Blattamonas nauphoetae]
MDCSPFLNWDGKKFVSEDEKAMVFRSLVATVKLQFALDDSLETKVVNFLNTVDVEAEGSADEFLHGLASLSHDPWTEFVQSMIVLVSSASEVITTTTMKVLKNLIWNISAKLNLTLVKADLIPQLIITLNPLSLSFAEAEDIHTSLISTITWSAWLSTPDGLGQLEIEDPNEQQAVHKTVFQQVVAPSENCLTIFEHEKTIWYFLYRMNNTQWKWNGKGGKVRQMWKTVHRVLRMEGIEDVIEEKLQNDGNGDWGENIVVQSIEWKGLLADEARCRFSSLSPTTPQLMTGCPLALHRGTSQPHSREDEIAVG